MPKFRNKEYPYTKKGIEEAAEARRSARSAKKSGKKVVKKKGYK